MNRIEHREEKWEFPFVEYSCDAKGEKLPLIIQLHGAGERGCGGKMLDLVDVHGFSKFLKDEDHRLIAVMPQCPKDSFWAARVESIVKFIEHLIREYPVDPDRVYLTGLSMGGYGTWFTAMARPDLFAAIAPVCGGGMAWNAGVLKMPIWAFHGTEDAVVSPM
ncbi:MAG: prolyl oligopeptidase family serine peptidase, partial [Clostridia bacterium]|nr:prolyl oligopeptidase family serine peptidase [Clostridia bacterium]